MTQRTEEQPLEQGELVHDPETGRVGEYQATVGPYAMLRPVGGGREWQADPARIRPATQAERLSAGVRAANERARTAGFDVSRPPVPVAGCTTCADLDRQREAARARFDHSGVTDAHVLLRQHQEREHGE
ncbi:hypothetical protein ABZ896_37780 [Streptomyces sp. NPDC047072]|uniref:hypothetical protein n=1 Tax=Streptomyces sp. NPDC047072 TaxID=3154809 RepID=UPI0033E17F9A